MDFGSTGTLCDNSWGVVSGHIDVRVDIDGVTLHNGALLPTASCFWSELWIGKQWCPWDNIPEDCPGKGALWAIDARAAMANGSAGDRSSSSGT